MDAHMTLITNVPHRIKLRHQLALLVVNTIINFTNKILFFINSLLFSHPLLKNPKNILIYRIGNIGDMVCAIPAFVAIRETYPDAKVTLLTSSGSKNSVGVKELFENAWYLDNLLIYYAEDINSLSKQKEFLAKLKKENYDLFIQLPDHWGKIRTLIRNMLFAKLLGAQAAYGFSLRTIINLFKKTQIDYLLTDNEPINLLNILKKYDIITKKIRFDFPDFPEAEKKIKNLLSAQWPDYPKDMLVVICPGGKDSVKNRGTEKYVGKQWPAERFGAISRYLQEKYQAKIIIVGSKEDVEASEIIMSCVKRDLALNLAGRLSLSETLSTLHYCAFVVCNDSGVMHLAAAIEKPTVALFSVINILGQWFPYGKQHEIIYHKFLDCDYKTKQCIRKSMEAISVEEVKNACDRLIGKI